MFHIVLAATRGESSSYAVFWTPKTRENSYLVLSITEFPFGGKAPVKFLSQASVPDKNLGQAKVIFLF
jgi:hypothetical protein